MKVLKFGGSSMSNAASISSVMDIVQHDLQEHRLWIVVSALKGTTEVLIKAGTQAAAGVDSYPGIIGGIEVLHLETVKQLIPVVSQSSTLSLVKTLFNEIEDIVHGIFTLGEFSPRTRDKLSGYGELLSSRILAAAFRARDIACLWQDSRELIRTDSQHTRAVVNFDITNRLIHDFAQQQEESLIILPGFIASDMQGATTTLGRNSSDYSAAILAAAVKASSLEIWTDVSGMKTADPHYVQHARSIPSISYEDAMELSHFGARVIYPPTLLPVMQQGIPTHIKNTFAPGDVGTLISTAVAADRNIIRGISSIDHITLISLEGSGMVGVPGFARRLFEALNQEEINVIMITQGSSEHSICAAIETAVAAKAKAAVDRTFAYEISTQQVKELITENTLSIIAVVGEQMKSRQGVSGKMFGALGRNGVNIRAIAQGSSERNISAVIASADVKKAINVLHEEFFETTCKQINLFLSGAGNVGSKLLEQIRRQNSYLEEQLRLRINVIGIANSKRVLIDENGIDLNRWESLLQQAPLLNGHSFTDRIVEKNLRNSVFADVTASEAVAMTYNRLLEKSIAVVACNKIACSSGYAYYKQLKHTAGAYNAAYLFETNVGAGLPVIGTLNDLVRSGDRLLKAEAVLSGTLNFVFNHYDGSRPFAQVVKEAQEAGLTEPDPRLDLSGKDVVRKMLILAREAGYALEAEDVSNKSFLPEACMQGTVADFYAALLRHEEHFRKLYEEAAAANAKLKFVARLEKGKATAGLQHITPEEAMYHLYGKDNVVLFYTERYGAQPLVIKGAGAGAEVTASGVFADILRAVH